MPSKHMSAAPTVVVGAALQIQQQATEHAQ